MLYTEEHQATHCCVGVVCDLACCFVVCLFFDRGAFQAQNIVSFVEWAVTVRLASDVDLDSSDL